MSIFKLPVDIRLWFFVRTRSVDFCLMSVVSCELVIVIIYLWESASTRHTRRCVYDKIKILYHSLPQFSLKSSRRNRIVKMSIIAVSKIPFRVNNH